MIKEFSEQYAAENKIRCHMPGHKGLDFSDSFFSGKTEHKSLNTRDITEIQGADCLYKAKGIIFQDERRASKLFNTADTFFSAGGCTLCIQTLVYLMRKREIFFYGEMHTSFFNICKILNIIPKQIENFEMISDNSAVFLTSPDYFGRIADIKDISEIVRKKNSFLTVDNAHGTHLAFYEKTQHPIHLGADFTCDSGFKTLPGQTGSAYIHTVHNGFREQFKHIMSMFGSSSPNYNILESLDFCNEYIEKNIKSDLASILPLLQKLKSPHWNSETTDLFHMAIKNNIPIRNIEPEYLCEDFIILLFSPMFKDISKVEEIIKGYEPYYPKQNDNRKIFSSYV
ncbi:MAG: PLP-dependent transferase [Oscillospiraceae bacterium]|jgi:arginine/lysine/ornithine decarboxylase|nr:PLP-dependent transferase [Oscillospiraceae bacterium]